MDFAEPHYILLLAFLVPLGVLAVARLERARRRDLETFAARALLARFSVLAGHQRRLAGQVLLLLTLCLVLLALARPRFGEKPLVLSRTGRDVLFVLDLSRSMNAEDAVPSRLRAAKQAIREVLEASPGDRVGLVVFGGSAFLQVPLTLDRAAFELFLEAAGTDQVSDPGTNLASAIAVAAGAFGSESEPRYRVAVLLSDGESQQGNLEGALARFEESGIRAFTVGVGTLEGAPIATRVGGRLLGYHRDAGGQVVVTRLEEESLRRIAQATDGNYFRWEGGAAARRLVSELSQLEKREISSRTFTQLADRYQWPLAAALLALVAEWLVAGSGRRRGGPAALLGAGVAAGLAVGLAAAPGLEAQQAGDPERLYRAGDFAQAYEAYRRRAEDEGVSPTLDYNMGNSLYRLGRYAEAARSYRDALAGKPALRQRSFYNMGNAYVKASEVLPDKRGALRRAVSAYEEALLREPGDRAAKWNLELALRRLAQEQERQSAGVGGGGGDGQEGSPPQGGGEESVRGGGGGEGEEPADAAPEAGGAEEPRSGGDGSALTAEQAKQLLEAIRSEEGETLEGRDRGRAQAVSGDKDW